MLFLSCNFNRNKKENDIPDNSKIVNDCTQVKENVSKDVLYQFRIENLKEYGKSINSYFQTFGRGKKVYEFKCKIDTVFNENYICYDYKIGIPFSIYVFKTKEEATDFFNKLMTIELVSDFGLNKRPNHILVDSNKVFWLKMEHTYGHRMNDIKDIFRKTFDFYPTSSNLDSISGFKYCRMINIKDTTLNEIFGEWYANSFIEMDTYEYFKNSSYNGVIKPNIDTLKLKITSKSITINNDEYFYNIFGALEFPNAKYYWEYRFISTMFDNQFDQLTPEFNKKLEHLMKYCKGIKDYDISVTKNNVRFAYFTIAKTNNKEIFVTLDNRFYILKKRL